MKPNIALLLVAASIRGGRAPEVAAQDDVVDGFVARSFKASNGESSPSMQTECT